MKNVSKISLQKRYDNLVKSVPTRAPIFLPTDRVPLKEKVEGMTRVKSIYDDKLDKIYRPTLKALREHYRGSKRCFIIGNGPSLNETDLTVLENEITFAVNGFFLKASDLSWSPTFMLLKIIWWLRTEKTVLIRSKDLSNSSPHIWHTVWKKGKYYLF